MVETLQSIVKWLSWDKMMVNNNTNINNIFHYIIYFIILCYCQFLPTTHFPLVQNQQSLWCSNKKYLSRYLHQLRMLYLFWKGRKYTFPKNFFTLYQLIIFHGKINKHLYLLKLWNHSDWKIKFCIVVFGLRKKLKNRRSSLMSEQNNLLMCYNFFLWYYQDMQIS